MSREEMMFDKEKLLSVFDQTKADALTVAIAAFINELLWTASDQEGGGPEQMLKELTHERRHLFQSAGLFERLSWKLA